MKSSPYSGSLYNFSRRKFVRYGSLALGAGVMSACAGGSQTTSTETPDTASTEPSGELDSVTFGTSWFAQAEHGGFYQALATGIDSIKAIQEGVPKVTVAAIFQKDPQALLAHPDMGIEGFEDLKDKTILLATSAHTTYWPFLKAKYGLTDEQMGVYTFNVGPFVADKEVVQQGYITSEPHAIQKEGGFDPVILLMADHGYPNYSCTIETRQEFLENNPDLVRRFVDASIKGWYSYLNGDPTPGNELIKQDNPEMTDEQIAYGIEKMKEYGIVMSGEAESMGIGAMTDDRWKSFFDTLVEAEVVPADMDYTEAFTLDFVNKGTDYYQ